MSTGKPLTARLGEIAAQRIRPGWRLVDLALLFINAPNASAKEPTTP